VWLDLLHVERGQTIVVMGAAGGVGGFAVQIAKARGARVIATVRGDVDEARRLGATEVYDTKTGGNVIDLIRASNPRGVDAVLDLVNGKDTIGQDAGILKSGGRLASTIFAADEAWFKERNIVAGNVGRAPNPKVSSEGLTELAGMLANSVITARIGLTVDLDGVPKMLDELRKGAIHGKAVIRL
jgi:NADPH:quinone reductase